MLPGRDVLAEPGGDDQTDVGVSVPDRLAHSGLVVLCSDGYDRGEILRLEHRRQRRRDARAVLVREGQSRGELRGRAEGETDDACKHERCDDPDQVERAVPGTEAQVLGCNDQHAPHVSPAEPCR